MEYYEEDIPRVVKDRLREYWQDLGLEERLGVKGRIMAERWIVWNIRHPDKQIDIEWDTRLSTKTQGFCFGPRGVTTVKGFSDMLEMMNYITRPFDNEKGYKEKFVQSVYGVTTYLKHSGAIRPETIPLLEDMPLHELRGPIAA